MIHHLSLNKLLLFILLIMLTTITTTSVQNFRKKINQDDTKHLFSYVRRRALLGGRIVDDLLNINTTTADQMMELQKSGQQIGNSSWVFYLNTNIPTSNNASSRNCNDISNPCTKGSQILNYFYDELYLKTNVIDIYVIGNLTECFDGSDRTNISTIDLLTIRFIAQNPNQYSYLNCNMRLKFINVYFKYFNFYKYNIRNLNTVGFSNCNIDSVSGMASGMLVMKQITAKRSDFQTSSVIDIDQIEMVECDLKVLFQDLYTWQLRVFQVNKLFNSSIVDSTIELSRLSMVSIENSAFIGTELTSIYTSALEINNCTVEDTSRWLRLRGTVVLSLQNSVIRNCPYHKSSRGIIESILSSYILINNCKFTSNNNRAIFVEETGYVHVVSSSFENNLGGIHIGTIVDLGDVLEGTHISSSRFIGNLAKNGGAISLPNTTSVIFKCEFYGNRALSGGAIYGLSGELELIDNKFERNEAYFTVGCSILSCGRGGAIYIENPTNFEVGKANIFRYNSARNGAGVYMQLSEYTSSLNLKLNCANNTVSYFGSCFYSRQDFPWHNYVSILDNSPNVLGSSLLKLVQFKPTVLSMYPGQRVSLSLTIIDGFNNTLQKMQDIPYFGTSDLRVQFESQFVNTEFVLSAQVVDESVKVVESYIILNSNNPNQINITVEILPCPSGFSLINYSASNSSKKICLKDADPPLYIILPAIFSSIVLFIVGILLGILMIYLGWNINNKLKRLKRKERAEKNLEKRLLDKQVVFSEEGELNSTELKASLLGSYYANSQGSTSSGKNRKIKEKIRLQGEQNYLIPIENVDIIKKLAEGANGIVYLAKWLGTDVAMKSLKLDYITEEENEEFEKEAALLKSLKHPNIVSSYGVCMSGNTKYMVVEYMTRGSLDRAIYDSRIGNEILKLEQKLNILLGVANGMTYLHSLKPYSIIHRDLKPGNILLDKNLSSKVTDFGLSKIIGGNSTNSMTTALGTLFYMAPEILGSDSSSDFSTKLDVYSFAIIMYELLFEESPYLNHRSQKIYRFITPHSSENAFNIPARVVQGLRPTIPFSSQEEQYIWLEEFVLPREIDLDLRVISSIFSLFIDLMVECWSDMSQDRPDFGEISDRLNEILKLI